MTDFDPQVLEGRTDLTGQCLIAMPGMGDPRFEHSLVYLCAHSEDGAMGLIVNKPTDELTMGELLEQLDVADTPRPLPAPVYFGGPVETGRGFVLHGDDYRSPMATLAVTAELRMTATLDVLEEIGAGRGPARYLMMLGYAGWGPGQLEGEIAQNAWLTCPADAELMFATPDVDKWESALSRIGVPALALSAEAGRA
jgi:putative transcriptional regulator